MQLDCDPLTRTRWRDFERLFGSNGACGCNLYSPIETAKANGIEPYAFLRSIFTDLPRATSVEQIEALLPVPAGDAKRRLSSEVLAKPGALHFV